MSDPRFVLAFDEPTLDHAAVGGKAANLARLSRAGFRVPAGFVVTTDAYAGLIAAAGLEKSIADLLDGVDLDDAAGLEECSGRIRALIEAADPPPSVAAAVREAYQRIGGFVAVRSSGTAEDLAETSFAGLHDTFLDVRGADAVLAAVRRCWASMWTARAIAYRRRGGFDQAGVSIAVVVQEMVAAEVSGVMFTGNPRTAATDELVVNAGWGLGEAVVSGLITPDEYVIRARDLSVKTAIPGDKSLLIRRADTGEGTVTEDVPDERREILTLTDERAAELADLGRRVQREYHEIPQDIEWALVDGEFHVLQARPVTGVDFSWDDEVEPLEKGADDDTIWDRAWGDTAFTGAISPLYYSCRAHTQDRGLSYTMDIQGLTEASELKHFKYHRGADYYNTATEKALALHTIWPFARDSPLCWGGTEYIEPAAREAIVAAPYDWTAFGVRQLRMNLRKASSWLGNIRVVYDRWVNDPRWDPENFPADKLPRLSDEELKRFTFRYLEEEYQYFEDVWIGFVHFRDAINLLAHLVGRWYDGPNPSALADLLTGVPGTSATMDENNELWGFADRIRRSPWLRAAFDANPGPDFLAALEGAASDNTEGRAFLADYRDFLRRCGHRGHSDRDIWYSRRVEDPWIDYRSWQAFLSSGDTTSPADREAAMRAARDRAVDEVLAHVRTKPLGRLKAELLHQVIDFVGKWLILRDDERASLDRHTYNLKLIFAEAGRRMHERGIIADQRDHYFLSKEELYEHLGGYGNRVLMRAKIAGRRKNFDRRFHQEISLPPYLRHGAEPWDPALEADGDPNRLGGTAQSKGSVTGTARVVPNLDRIGSVAHGEILVCNATDPGWTPVFLVISGIVTETGGVLSHAACLSREYGLPAVQLAGAMRRIPDGATITVDGDTGEVRIQADAAEEAP